MDAANPDCPEVHLTNNAVQKQVAGYGQYEDGNQLSYAQFQQYLDSIPGNQHNFYAEWLPRMKAITVQTLSAARKYLNDNNSKSGFELLGFDFMLDADFTTWLIEVNTNPWIEESSEMLKHYLRRMLNDMLKLTLDKSFPEIKR